MRKKKLTLEELREELKDYSFYALDSDYPVDGEGVESFIEGYYLVFCKFLVEDCYPERLTLFGDGNTFKISFIHTVERLKSGKECKYHIFCLSPFTSEEKHYILRVI